MSAAIYLIIAVVALIGALTGLMMLPARIHLEIVDDHLVVEPLGLDKVWCVRGKVEVPLDLVATIEAADRHTLPKPGVRLPGAYMPGIIMAGSYGTGSHRTFWDVRRADRVLVVNCLPGFAFRQLVLEVADPDAVAATLRTSIGR